MAGHLGKEPGSLCFFFLSTARPEKNALFRPRLFLLGFRPRFRVAGHLERMPKQASRYGFVLRNQTNLNRPRIGESEANPESRVAGHLERMPKEASRYGFVLRNQTNGSVNPRFGESEAKPESRVARPLRKGARLLLYLIIQSPAREKTHYLNQGFFCLVSATVRGISDES